MSFVLATFLFVSCQTDDPVRVTVVIVLATSKNDVIDPKLKDLAREVQKREPTLTGYKLVAIDSRSVRVGDEATIPLTDKQVLGVKVEKPKDAHGRIGLTLDPPGMDPVTYACACDKFFPIVTPHRTKKDE